MIVGFGGLKPSASVGKATFPSSPPRQLEESTWKGNLFISKFSFSVGYPPSAWNFTDTLLKACFKDSRPLFGVPGQTESSD